jgi:hypothetical protein
MRSVVCGQRIPKKADKAWQKQTLKRKCRQKANPQKKGSSNQVQLGEKS